LPCFSFILLKKAQNETLHEILDKLLNL
jgi:hypothetical protein